MTAPWGWDNPPLGHPPWRIVEQRRFFGTTLTGSHPFSLVMPLKDASNLVASLATQARPPTDRSGEADQRQHRMHQLP